MSQKKKQDELNSTEEIVSQSEKFIERNISKISIVVLIIIAIILGFFAYQHFVKKPRAEKAMESMYKAEESFINENDSVALYGNGSAQMGLLQVAKEYSGTDASNLAHAYAGICFYDAGKYKEALEQLDKFSASENMVAPSIERLKGDCYVQLDQLDKAVSCFEKAATMADNDVISPSCLFKAGHVYEEQGQYEKAQKAYQTIKDKYYANADALAKVENDLLRVAAKLKK